MPYMSSNNIPSNIFYSALIGEFLRIASSTLLLDDFLPKALSILKRMINQGGEEQASLCYLHRIILRHQECFNSFQITPAELIAKSK